MKRIAILVLLFVSIGRLAAVAQPKDPYADSKAAPKKDAAADAKKQPAPPPPKQPDDPYAPAIPPRIGLADVGQVPGLLAVQHLDGWLWCDRDGVNPIAVQKS